jgi:hypothetical protein
LNRKVGKIGKLVVAGLAEPGRIPVGPSLLVPLPTIRGSKLPTYAKPRPQRFDRATADDPGYRTGPATKRKATEAG